MLHDIHLLGLDIRSPVIIIYFNKMWGKLKRQNHLTNYTIRNGLMMMIKRMILNVLGFFGYSLQKKGYLPPRYWSNKTDAELRTLFHYAMFEKTKLLEGDIVEVGVAAGATIAFLNNLSVQFGINKNLYGFDSFEGFSEPHEKDGVYFKNKFSILKKSYSKFTIDVVNKNLIDWCGSSDKVKNIKLTKGYIPDTLCKYNGTKISLMNIDLDIYQPTLDSLRFFWPMLQKGGIMMLDEYDFGRDLEKWPGAKAAADEFCEEKKIEVQKHFSGRAFLIKTN